MSKFCKSRALITRYLMLDVAQWLLRSAQGGSVFAQTEKFLEGTLSGGWNVFHLSVVQMLKKPLLQLNYCQMHHVAPRRLIK